MNILKTDKAYLQKQVKKYSSDFRDHKDNTELVEFYKNKVKNYQEKQN